MLMQRNLEMLTFAQFRAIAAQWGLNTALLACPLTWIVLAILVVVTVIYTLCSAIAKMTGLASSGFGIICGAINVVIQFFKNLWMEVTNSELGIGFAIGAVAFNFQTAFKNAISNIQSFFYNLLSTVLEVIGSIAEELNKLPFIEFDYSGVTDKANEYATKAAQISVDKGEYKSISDAFNKGMNTFDAFQEGWFTDAFNAGVAWVDDGGLNDLLKDVKNPFGEKDIDLSNFGDVASDIADTADNTGALKDSLDRTEEDLKYMRNLADMEQINRFTTAEIKIDMTNHNNINNGNDWDGLLTSLSEKITEFAQNSAEGVYDVV